MKNLITTALLLFLGITWATDARAQSSTTVADVATRINRERIARGLVPYAVNAQLNQAAQAHASDIAATGNFSHTGSDGSTVFNRVERTKYGAYSWGRRLGENWAWYPTAERAVAEWMDSKPHRDNILHALYREMGIGIAARNGNLVIVIDFGAQPNVLPFFINNYDSETRSPNVTLTFSSEDVVPAGDGASIIGQATQIQVSNNADFSGATWQPFAKQIQWTLTAGDGVKTVYAKYRDVRGRMATANDSITLNQSSESPARAAGAAPVQQPTTANGGTVTPTITRTSTRGVTPTQTRAILGLVSVTPTPTVTSTATLTATPEPSATRIVTPTVTPTPTRVNLTTTPSEDNTSIFVVSVTGLGLLLGALGLARFLAERSSFDEQDSRT